jgi:hypothetical protein
MDNNNKLPEGWGNQAQSENTDVQSEPEVIVEKANPKVAIIAVVIALLVLIPAGAFGLIGGFGGFGGGGNGGNGYGNGVEQDSGEGTENKTAITAEPTEGTVTYTTTTTESATNTEITTTVIVEQELTPEDLTWLVEPTLNYESFWFCNGCDIGFSNDGWQINERTGMPIDNFHGGHGGWIEEKWVYDPANSLLGLVERDIDLHPINQFSTKFPSYTNQVLTIHSVDSSKQEFFNCEMDGARWIMPDSAYHGTVAVMFNGEFVTDFEFKGVGSGRVVSDVVSVTQNGMHGIVDKNGNIVIPFILEEILIICDSTAFAKHNGLWGIISI